MCWGGGGGRRGKKETNCSFINVGKPKRNNKPCACSLKNKQTKTKKTVKTKQRNTRTQICRFNIFLQNTFYVSLPHYSYRPEIIFQWKKKWEQKKVAWGGGGGGALKREKKKKVSWFIDLIRTYFSAQQAQLCPRWKRPEEKLSWCNRNSPRAACRVKQKQQQRQFETEPASGAQGASVMTTEAGTRYVCEYGGDLLWVDPLSSWFSNGCIIWPCCIPPPPPPPPHPRK